MAIDITAIFGTEIRVACQPRRSTRQLAGFAGAHGMTSMNMGTRGRVITVTGRLSYTYNPATQDYWDGRTALQAAIDAIEAYQWTDGGTYTYNTQTFYSVIFELFQLIPDGDGKVFHHAAPSKVFVNFTAALRSLL